MCVKVKEERQTSQARSNYHLGANNVHPDQMYPLGEFDLGLRCLPRYVCPNTTEMVKNRQKDVYVAMSNSSFKI